MRLRIDNDELGEISIEALAARLTGLSDRARAEVWLDHDECSICLLKHDDRAMLMLLRFDGDSGLTSRASDDQDDIALDFMLSNGQRDEYPVGWTIPYGDARRALEYFWSHKDAAPFIAWSEEAG